MSLIVPENGNVRVSSVLNNDRKQFGKKYIFDGKDETCWNSDQGSPQWIEVRFPEPKKLAKFSIQFQGGFAGKDCELQSVQETTESVTGESTSDVIKFYPKDSNVEQDFDCVDVKPSTVYKFIFPSSTDFYGRITVYHLKLFGSD